MGERTTMVSSVDDELNGSRSHENSHRSHEHQHHRESDDDEDDVATATTLLTNPGIIDRLETDVADYLHPFGFRIERISASGACDRNDGGGGRAAFLIPRRSRTLQPIGTIRLRVEEERLLPTVGPLLRTCVRLSHPGMSPMRLRAVVDCDFVLGEAAVNDDGANSKRRRRVRSNGREDYYGDADNGENDENAESLKAVARRMAHHVHMLVRNSMGSALCIDLVVVLPRYPVKERMPPLSSHLVESVMQNNPDACYPSVRLLARAVIEDSNVVDCGGDGLDLTVRTRMCTVRHSPTVFRWLYSLSWSPFDYRSPSCREAICPLKPQMHGSGEGKAFVPIVVACIEKVANLHRVLMLSHYLDETHSDNTGIRNGNNRFDKGHFLESSLSLSNVVVVLPNNAGGDGRRDEVRLREFEDAVNNFHEVVVGADRGRDGSHRPTFAHEEHAAGIISYMIKQRYTVSPSSSPPSTRSPSIVGIDLHPSALTLDGDYRDTTVPISPAVHMVRNADAIIFGYESTGIPKVLADSLNGWVQIPSRSSINVVAAMSIILDALLGVGKC